MPGNSFQGPLPPLSDGHHNLKGELRTSVQVLAGDIGERNLYRYDNLVRAAEYIRTTFSGIGYDVTDQSYKVDGKVCQNIEVEVVGTEQPEEILLIGAHYDSVRGSPGANDNGTGIAALLSLARAFRQTPAKHSIRFVAFVNEEPPFFQTKDMGSYRYAQRSRERDESIVLMMSLETIGYYSDEPGSQSYPPPLSVFYPNIGNFIAFVGNTEHAHWVETVIKIFREEGSFPSEGAALWGWIPGVGWSDHWAFWKEGFAGIMVTDTAPFRYPFYHTGQDTPDKVHYEHLTRVVVGLHRIISRLANPPNRKSL